MQMNRTIALLLLFPLTATAGTIYKCKDAKGVSSYSQTPCPTAKADAGTRNFVKTADSPGLSWSGQAARKQAETQPVSGAQHYQPVKTVQATPPKQGIMAMYSDLSSDEARRRIENLSLSPEGRALLRTMSGQQLPTQRANNPPPEEAVQEGVTQRRDNRGNTYTQQPGSPFVRDNKTGQKCFVYGNNVKCK